MLLTSWLLATFGCAPALPEPTLEAMAPVWGWTGETTDVTLVGTNLLPSVYAYADTRGDTRVYDDFQVELVGDDGLVIPLSGEDLDTYKAVSAQVPAGHPVGVYDVRLTTPTGVQTVLTDGFSITETRADHLQFVIEEVAFQLTDSAVFDIRLVDPDSQLVGEDLEIEVRADPDLLTEQLTFNTSSLKDFSDLADGVGVRGRLGSDGEATISVSAAVPGSVRLSVIPQDPDSFIRGDEVFFEFSPGAIDHLEFVFSEDFDPTVAVGDDPDEPQNIVTVSAVDADGHVVYDQALDLTLSERCGTYSHTQEVIGSGNFNVVLTGATDDDCPENVLTVTGDATGKSDGFEVSPGEPFSLRLLPAGEEATAGEPYAVFIWAVDEHGNTVSDLAGDVTLDDSELSLANWSCEPGSIQYCTLEFAVATEATDGTVLRATWQLIVGLSEPIRVVAGPASGLELTAPGSPLVAGTEFTVSAEVTDDYGNGATIDPGGDDPFEVTATEGPLSCAWGGPGDPGQYTLDCSLTEAGTDLELTVSVPSHDLDARITDIEVVNAALDHVTLEAGSDTVEAGALLTLTVAAFDVYENPYVVQSDAVIDLADGAQTLSPTVLTLDSGGGAVGEGFILLSAGDPVTVTASQAAVDLGSVALTVTPAAVDHLDVSLSSAWTWLDTPLTLTITAHDEYENTVTDYASTLALTSAQGAFSATSLSAFSQGIASRSLDWDSAILVDTVTAIGDDGILGTSDAVDVLDGDCASPPTAVLTLDGQSEAVTCLISGVASVTADFSASASTAGLQAYHLDEGRGESQRLSADSAVLDTDTEGGWRVGLVVADADSCGAETSATWWAGDADGEPVGPIALETAHTQRTAGSTTNGATTAGIAATTCSGDLAASGTVLVRSDLGTVVGPSSTGAGLALVLDSAGAGSLTWTVETETHAGVATLEVGTEDGASWGETSVTVTGDSERPTVVSVDPSGLTAELLDEVVVVFTEPMEAGSLTSATVSLDSSSGSATVVGHDLDSDGTALTLTLDSTLDASLDAWALTVTSGARDEAGNNRLDGSWGGAAADFTAAFGSVSDEALTVTSCVADTAVLTPDADDGAGDEADSLTVAATASASPTWWVLEVRDDSSAAVRTTRQAGSGPSASLSWDGRDDAGFVVAPGAYTLAVSTLDASDNLSTSCESEVTLHQHYGEPG